MEPAATVDGHRTSTSGRQRQKLFDDDDGPKVGARRLMLGRRESARYTTQYSIDVSRQLTHIKNEVMSDDCLPFLHCPRSRRYVAVAWLWSFIRSETYLYSLHVISIALGAVNSGLELRENNADASLAQSTVETSATLFLILARMANGYTGYKEVRCATRIDQNFDPDSDVHVRRVRHLLIFYLISGALLFAFALTFFFVFLYRFHLGWTILTNNFCLITILVLWSIYSTLINTTAAKVREDQFKVVIHEALDMIGNMSEMLSTTSADGQRRAQLAEQFIGVVRDSKLLAMPDYVSLTDRDVAVTTVNDDQLAPTRPADTNL